MRAAQRVKPTLRVPPPDGAHMTTSMWSTIHENWSLMEPPIRPAVSVVRAVSRELGGRSRRVLLLGVTPELAEIGDDVTAVDSSEDMIRGVWSGDAPGRRVVHGDWFDLPFEDGAFDGVVGDGCLSVVGSRGLPPLLRQVARVLRPGGRFVVRLFAAPDAGPTPEQIRDDAFAGRFGSVFAMRWRLAMALAARRTNHDLPMSEWARTFVELCPDRAALQQATGWDRRCIDNVDLFMHTEQVSCFAPAPAVLAAVPPPFASARLVPTDGYEVAECCPLLVAARAG